MRETRGGHYGGNLAILIRYVFNTIPEDKRDSYKKEFFKELGDFSNNAHELKDIDLVDVNKPCELAKLVKESLHLMYQKNTSNNALDGFLENL
jgi:NDP-sugar pyrophosphorylase family protein